MTALGKPLGALLILLSGGLAAAVRIAQEKKKLWVLEGWLGLIRHTRTQIDCYLMPLEEIMQVADREVLRAAGAGLTNGSARELLQNAAPYLSVESRRLLGALLGELGSSYREEQLRRCDHYLAALEREREQLAAALPARIRLCLGMGLCGALGIAIVLW